MDIINGNKPNINNGFSVPSIKGGTIPAITQVNIQLLIKHIVCNIHHPEGVVCPVLLFIIFIFKYYN